MVLVFSSTFTQDWTCIIYILFLVTTNLKYCYDKKDIVFINFYKYPSFPYQIETNYTLYIEQYFRSNLCSIAVDESHCIVEWLVKLM